VRQRATDLARTYQCDLVSRHQINVLDCWKSRALRRH
jgi:hypothetical protein